MRDQARREADETRARGQDLRATVKDDGHDHDHDHSSPIMPPQPASPAMNNTSEVQVDETEDQFITSTDEIDLDALVAGNNSPPTRNQLLNILSSKLEGFINPEGILDTTGLFSELPRKIVGRRSRSGAEFGCNWPQDMRYWGADYESQSAACKSEMIWERVLEDDRIQDWFDGVAQLPLFF